MIWGKLQGLHLGELCVLWYVFPSSESMMSSPCWRQYILVLQHKKQTYLNLPTWVQQGNALRWRVKARARCTTAWSLHSTAIISKCVLLTSTRLHPSATICWQTGTDRWPPLSSPEWRAGVTPGQSRMLKVGAESAAHQRRAVARSETDAFVAGSANLVESICAAVSRVGNCRVMCLHQYYTVTSLTLGIKSNIMALEI